MKGKSYKGQKSEASKNWHDIDPNSGSFFGNMAC